MAGVFQRAALHRKTPRRHSERSFAADAGGGETQCRAESARRLWDCGAIADRNAGGGGLVGLRARPSPPPPPVRVSDPSLRFGRKASQNSAQDDGLFFGSLRARRGVVLADCAKRGARDWERRLSSRRAASRQGLRRLESRRSRSAPPTYFTVSARASNKCLLKIAQHFSAGSGSQSENSPAGTEAPFFRPCGTGALFPSVPSTEVLGYFQGN